MTDGTSASASASSDAGDSPTGQPDDGAPTGADDGAPDDGGESADVDTSEESDGGGMLPPPDCDDVPVDGPSMVPAELAGVTATASQVDADGFVVTFADYPVAYDDAHLWSMWGRGNIAHGRFYSAIGDHDSAGTSTNYDGNSYLYEFDPATDELRAVGDVLTAFGQHVSSENGYGKVHGRIDEGPCGLLWFHSYWGSAGAVEYQGQYQGDILLSYNPWTEHLESRGVQVDQTGTPSTNIWRAGGLFYGEANTPGTGFGDGTEAAFWAYDTATGEKIYEGEFKDRRNRNIAVDAVGRAYTNDGASGLTRFDPETLTETPSTATFSKGGFLRASTQPLPDGSIIMVTHGDVQRAFYRFDPDNDTLTHLADVGDYVADIEMDPTGSVVYFIPGAHGNSEDYPLMELDIESGTIRTLLALAPVVEAGGATRPTGTYSVSVSADGRTVYVPSNGGPDNAFGAPVFVAVELPEAELP